MMITGSRALFVESRVVDGSWDNLVLVIDCIAAFTFIVGLLSLVVYRWFPDPRRKYSWRRKQLRGTADPES